MEYQIQNQAAENKLLVSSYYKLKYFALLLYIKAEMKNHANIDT